MVAVATPSPAVRLSRPVRPSPAVARRRRLVGAVVVALVAASCIWLAFQAHPGASGGGPLTTTGAPAVLGAHRAAVHVWVVRPGDTVWGIVESMGVKGDPRPVVDGLAAQVGDRPLQPGERLVLP